MITDIYRIKTRNSIYEIQVQAFENRQISRCRKCSSTVSVDGFTAEGPWRKVNASSLDYLEKLHIGASFDVPGVVTTSVVEDYNHFVISDEPKRYLEQITTISGFFQEMTDLVVEQVHGGVAMMAEPQRPMMMMATAPIEAGRVYKGYGPGCSETNHIGGCTCDLPPTCKVPGCDYSSKYGPGHNGSRMCKSGSIASGGTRAHCACDYCY